MKRRTIVELPGYVTIAVAAERLRLAPRSVRDLVYAGRVPSARLGRRHFLRVSDVEAERRRRLGLPLPATRAATPRRRVLRRPSEVAPTPLRAEGTGQARVASPTSVETRPGRAASPASAEARRARAEQRAAELERWLRSGHAAGEPTLPFAAVEIGAEAGACDACRRPVRAGGRMVEAAPADGRPAARLCLTCARRTVLAWSDSRRREAIAARRLAHELGTTYTPLLEPASTAAA